MAFPFTFGTATDVSTGPLSTTYANIPYDGILDLALPQLSQLPPDITFIPFLFDTGQIASSLFSLRLSSDNAVSEMFLGGVNPAKFTGPFETHPVAPQSGFWELSGGTVVVNTANLFTGQNFILDSGANFIFGDPAAVTAFYRDAFPGFAIFDPIQGFFEFPCASQFPTIALSFGGRQWVISRNT